MRKTICNDSRFGLGEPTRAIDVKTTQILTQHVSSAAGCQCSKREVRGASFAHLLHVKAVQVWGEVQVLVAVVSSPEGSVYINHLVCVTRHTSTCVFHFIIILLKSLSNIRTRRYLGLHHHGQLAS